ncbi:hypothetical protein BEWA_022420 [Theileria equi strain WA]|uniref:Uncharacterized protein n=1 Tax=Theileria equi strain WA TaxID=1537102 RepID=L0AWZ3_THEEQ|nr:hypothetical protein BEWA_022420 [Theileria equi strain WA]AFZ79394.1 hypothetical protein BEWA_022420 [Theileria equi strain WA]|eukprot:XP_004829060.1 hypothetical protein BEWA_022420 [Theileria equi strain WA]
MESLEDVEVDESNTLLYKVMINRKIVEKVQMNMSAHEKSNGAQSHNEEVELLKRYNKELETKYNDTFAALDQVRKNALEASESNLSREFRIAFLEKALHGCEKNLLESEDRLKQAKKMVDDVKLASKKEVSILEVQMKRLFEIVKERDSTIASLTTNLSKSNAELDEMKSKRDELILQLKRMCDNLNNIIKERNQKEKMIAKLEADLNKRDLERQELYLNEMNRNRRMYIDIKVKENLMSQIISDKNKYISELSSEIDILKGKLDGINKAFYELSLPKYDAMRRQNRTSCVSQNKVTFSTSQRV